MKKRKFIASTLILAMLFTTSLTGCKTKSKDEEQEDEESVTIEDLEDIPADFLEALANEDIKTMDALVDDFVGDPTYEIVLEINEEAAVVMEYAMAHSEVKECDNLKLNKDGTEARMTVTFSYFNLEDFGDVIGYEYLYMDEYMDLMEDYDERAEVDLKLRFVYDEDEDTWLMTNESAAHISGLFTSQINYVNLPVNLTPDDAKAVVEEYLNDLATDGYSDLNQDFSYEDVRLYDNVVVRGHGDKTSEAVQYFVKQYASYILNHDYEIVQGDTPYSFSIVGYAPSSDDLYNAFDNDKFRATYFANFLRIGLLEMDEEEVWDDQSALIYRTLADAVPNCSPENYSYYLNISPMNEESPIYAHSIFVNEPSRGIFEFEHSVSYDEMVTAYTGAAEKLLEYNEINQEQYDFIISSLTPEGLGFSSGDSGNGNGGSGSGGSGEGPTNHPNQAVGVYEQTPEFITDGSLVYGYSNPDVNGIWMHYSKQPGWLDTVDYYIGDDGIWITNHYDIKFNKGTDLIVDWWVDDQQVVDTEMVNITSDGTDTVEVSLSPDLYKGANKVEMRLWEDDHSHVISYVTLYLK